MARTVADVRALFEVLAGPDAGDSLSAPVPVRKVNERELHGLRVGILESDELGKATPETTAAVEWAGKILSEQGFAVEPKRLEGLHQAIELWWYFFGPVIAHLIRQGFDAQESAVSPMLKEFVALATAERQMEFGEFLHACGERDQLRGEILRQMQDVTVLLSPVSTGPAFKHGEGNWRTGERENYRDTMRYSQWLNLAGFPGMAVPVSASPDGLPIGVQVIGRPYEEEVVLAVAEAIERGRKNWLAPRVMD
jgi:Asp-tRNA(Asn)/Glu-tRNA(Gln) amidotransferase A subunit family amidase